MIPDPPMIPAPLAWFAFGATFGIVLCSWPWRQQFSRYERCTGNYRRRQWSPIPASQEFYNGPTYEGITVKGAPLCCPSQKIIAECGGPCREGFRHCDCNLILQLNPRLRLPPSRSIS
jgi:hypothetical protein